MAEKGLDPCNFCLESPGVSAKAPDISGSVILLATSNAILFNCLLFFIFGRFLVLFCVGSFISSHYDKLKPNDVTMFAIACSYIWLHPKISYY
jgi:hypothetical protein